MSYIDKVAESIHNVQKQLQGVASATHDANRSAESYFKYFEARGRAMDGDGKKLAEVIQQRLAPYAKLNKYVGSGIALKIASENKAIAESYKEHEHAVESLSSMMTDYESRIRSQMAAASDPRTSAAEAAVIEKSIRSLKRRSREAGAEASKHKAMLASMDTEETKLALAGKSVVESVEGITYAMRGLAAITGFSVIEDGMDYMFQLNDALVEANVSESTRNKLFEQSIKSAAHLGVALSDVTNVQDALVERGFDMVGITDSTVRNILRMETGLGATVGPVVQLVGTVDAVGGKFDDVANSIARIVDVTAVAADEAARYAIEMNKIALVTGQSGENVGQATRLISAVEGQMKRYGLDSGSFVEMIKQANSLEGSGLSMMFGGGFQQMIGDPDRLSEFMANLGSFVENVDPITRQAYASSFGVDPAMLAVLAEHPGEIAKALADVQEEMKNDELVVRYREQLGMTNKAWDRAGQSLKNLAMVGLAPLSKLALIASESVSYVTDRITHFISGDFLDGEDATPLTKFLHKSITHAFKVGFPSVVVAAFIYGMKGIATKIKELYHSFMSLSTFIKNADKSVMKLSSAMNTLSASMEGATLSARRGSQYAQYEKKRNRGRRIVSDKTAVADAVINPADITQQGKLRVRLGSTVGSIVAMYATDMIFQRVAESVESSKMSDNSKGLAQSGLEIANMALNVALLVYGKEIFGGFKKGFKMLRGVNYSKIFTSEGIFVKIWNGIVSSFGKMRGFFSLSKLGNLLKPVKSFLMRIPSVLSKIPGIPFLMKRLGTLGRLLPKFAGFSVKAASKALGKFFMIATSTWNAVEGWKNAEAKFGKPVGILGKAKSAVHEVLDGFAGFADFILQDVMQLDVSLRNVNDKIFGVQKRQTGVLSSTYGERSMIWDYLRGNPQFKEADRQTFADLIERAGSANSRNSMLSALVTGNGESFDSRIQGWEKNLSKYLESFDEGHDRDEAKRQIDVAINRFRRIPFEVYDAVKGAATSKMYDDQNIGNLIDRTNPYGHYGENGQWERSQYSTGAFSEAIRQLQLGSGVKMDYQESENGEKVELTPRNSDRDSNDSGELRDAINGMTVTMNRIIDTINARSNASLSATNRHNQLSTKLNFANA